MNKQYVRRITNRILEDTNHFIFYVAKESKGLAREVFEEMGLEVTGEIPYIRDGLIVLGVRR
jgi:hypothetical protein